MSELTERMSVTLPRSLHAKIQSYRRARAAFASLELADETGQPAT